MIRNILAVAIAFFVVAQLDAGPIRNLANKLRPHRQQASVSTVRTSAPVVRTTAPARSGGCVGGNCPVPR